MTTDDTSLLLNDIDFDALGDQMRHAPGFPHFCIDDFLEESFANEVHDAFPSYQEALVQCPSGTARKSFAVYYYTKEAPVEWDGVRRSTVFRARPEEYWKGTVAMPAEQIARAGRRTFESLKRKARRLLR